MAILSPRSVLNHFSLKKSVQNYNKKAIQTILLRVFCYLCPKFTRKSAFRQHKPPTTERKDPTYNELDGPHIDFPANH